MHDGFLPFDHICALREIETGYWWYVGRIEQAVAIASRWIKHASLSSIDHADLGCGTGGFARALRTRLPIRRTALVDGDAKALSQISERDDLEILQRNLSQPLQLPWRPNLVTLMDVIEHLPDDSAVLKSVAEALQPNGAVLISVPAFQFLFSEWDKQLGHRRRYTAKSLRTAIEAAGLNVVEIRYTWSFLFPVAPYRKFRKNRYQKNMEFEKSPGWINQVFIRLAKWEIRLPAFLRLPFGTSVMALAVKK